MCILLFQIDEPLLDCVDKVQQVLNTDLVVISVYF